MIKQSSSMKNLVAMKKTCYRIMDEAPNHDAMEVPEWLDILLSQLSLDVATLREEEKNEKH